MVATQSEPTIAALLVAQDAFRDERGRVHVYGIFDTMASPQFPLVTAFMVFVAFRGTKQGTYQAMIQMVDSLGNKIIQTDQMVFEVSEFKGHNLYIKLRVRLPSPQLYRIQLFVEGAERLAMPLMVRQAEAAPPPILIFHGLRKIAERCYMATADVKDIAEISEACSDATYIYVKDDSYQAPIEDLLELLEDEEDIREGLKALADDEGTISWEEYTRQRKERERRGELPR